MHSHMQKWGNSLGIRIPKQIAKQLQLTQGSPVVISIENDKIIIQPPKYDLETMLKEIKKKNLHNEAFDDGQRGNEAW